jgi:hypothetical protein
MAREPYNHFKGVNISAYLRIINHHDLMELIVRLIGEYVSKTGAPCMFMAGQPKVDLKYPNNIYTIFHGDILDLVLTFLNNVHKKTGAGPDANVVLYPYLHNMYDNNPMPACFGGAMRPLEQFHYHEYELPNHLKGFRTQMVLKYGCQILTPANVITEKPKKRPIVSSKKGHGYDYSFRFSQKKRRICKKKDKKKADETIPKPITTVATPSEPKPKPKRKPKKKATPPPPAPKSTTNVITSLLDYCPPSIVSIPDVSYEPLIVTQMKESMLRLNPIETMPETIDLTKQLAENEAIRNILRLNDNEIQDQNDLSKSDFMASMFDDIFGEHVYIKPDPDEYHARHDYIHHNTNDNNKENEPETETELSYKSTLPSPETTTEHETSCINYDEAIIWNPPMFKIPKIKRKNPGPVSVKYSRVFADMFRNGNIIWDNVEANTKRQRNHKTKLKASRKKRRSSDATHV